MMQKYNIELVKMLDDMLPGTKGLLSFSRNTKNPTAGFRVEEGKVTERWYYCRLLPIYSLSCIMDYVKPIGETAIIASEVIQENKNESKRV